MSEELSLYQYYKTLLRPAPLIEHCWAYACGRELALCLIEEALFRLEVEGDSENRTCKRLVSRLKSIETKIRQMPPHTHESQKFDELGRLLIRLHVLLKRVQEYIEKEAEESRVV